MKNYFLLFCLVAIGLSCAGQDSSQMRSNEYNYDQFLLQKSKKLERTGWIVFGTGVSVCIIAFLIPKGEYREAGPFDWGLGSSYSNSELRTNLFLGGLTCIGVSFFLFGRATMTKTRHLSAY